MKTVVSMDVTFVWSEVSTTCLNMSVQEAYNVKFIELQADHPVAVRGH